MADWVNKGSYQDLSGMLPGDKVSALTPTSQAAGNMMSSNKNAMTAPGGQPVDPLPPSSDQGDVDIDVAGSQIPPSTDGKPQPREGAAAPGQARWGYLTPPNVVRKS